MNSGVAFTFLMDHVQTSLFAGKSVGNTDGKVGKNSDGKVGENTDGKVGKIMHCKIGENMLFCQ